MNMLPVEFAAELRHDVVDFRMENKDTLLLISVLVMSVAGGHDCSVMGMIAGCNSL